MKINCWRSMLRGGQERKRLLLDCKLAYGSQLLARNAARRAEGKRLLLDCKLAYGSQLLAQNAARRAEGKRLLPGCIREMAAVLSTE